MGGRPRGSSEQAVLTMMVVEQSNVATTINTLKMQRDTTCTFRQIQGSEEAFLSAIEDVERVALVEQPLQTPPRLRFLTPSPGNESVHHYIITEAQTHRTGDTYVAVSYTWAHEQSVEGLTIPEYRILDLSKPGSEWRPPRCPPVVLHRTIAYARAHGYSYVWIDQECIHQDDPADVERHLQVMHRIYFNSKITIAVLSTYFFTHSLAASGLASLMESRQDLPSDIWPQPMHNLGDWLVDMTNDRWFFRTWAFQEKLSASSTRLLLPTARSPEATPSLPDTCLDLRVMWEIASKLALHESVWGRSNARLKKMLEGRPAGRLEDAVIRLDPSGSMPTPRRLMLSKIYNMYQKMESCDNSVTADRLAILANICDLTYRLKSTELNKPSYSYSTCLMALVFANIWPDREKRLGRYKELMAGLMDADVQSALYYLAEQTSAHGLDAKVWIESAHQIQDVVQAHRSGRPRASLSFQARPSMRPRSVRSMDRKDETWPLSLEKPPPRDIKPSNRLLPAARTEARTLLGFVMITAQVATSFVPK